MTLLTLIVMALLYAAFRSIRLGLGGIFYRRGQFGQKLMLEDAETYILIGTRSLCLGGMAFGLILLALVFQPYLKRLGLFCFAFIWPVIVFGFHFTEIWSASLRSNHIDWIYFRLTLIWSVPYLLAVLVSGMSSIFWGKRVLAFIVSGLVPPEKRGKLSQLLDD